MHSSTVLGGARLHFADKADISIRSSQSPLFRRGGTADAPSWLTCIMSTPGHLLISPLQQHIERAWAR